MDKLKLKSFAIWARRELIKDVTYKAGLIGISEEEIKDPVYKTNELQMFDIGTKDPYTIKGEEIQQRNSLLRKVKEKGFNLVVEEVAYTWFNRIIAIRYMEVNNYMPTKVRVLSSETTGKVEPDMVTVAPNIEFTFTDKERFEVIPILKQENKLDELFKLLFIKQCNELNKILPALFEKTNDYSELLLDISFTNEDSVIRKLINEIEEENYCKQVEIIGWLYQYYNSDLKDEAFAMLKKSVKISKERIPAVTQLFTPDWIVRYMVENSLGRFWLDRHTNDSLKSKWNYYINETEQELEVQNHLEYIRKKYKKIKPEEIKIIDPCMGSGHVLVYCFDILMHIYESKGYNQRDAAISIVNNNLCGLDIDNRAYQLAYFAVMMKARQYNRSILSKGTSCRVYSIYESNNVNRDHLKHFGVEMNYLERSSAMKQMNYLLDDFTDAKEYGSILKIGNYDWKLLNQFIDNFNLNYLLTLETIGIEDTVEVIQKIVNIGIVMTQEYDVVVTNPPYMGGNGMSPKLNKFVKTNYPDTKSDLSTVFMEKSLDLCQKYGLMSMINIPVWMTLSSYGDYRKKLISNNTIVNMIHFGRGVFGADFGTTSFVIKKENISNYLGSYRRLFVKRGSVDSLEKKEKWFFEGLGKYNSTQENFLKIPGSPISYWISDAGLKAFENGKLMKSILKPKQGTSTGNDEKYVRFWFEVNYEKCGFNCQDINQALDSTMRYFPLDKGGAYRKWYGNNEKIIKMDNDSYSELISMGNHLPSRGLYFHRGLTWSKITSGKFSIRYDDYGFVFSSIGLKGFPEDELLFSVLGFMNSKISEYYIEVISPGMSTESGHLEKIPYYEHYNEKKDVELIVRQCIEQAKNDWDSNEKSWDFIRHDLISDTQLISLAYKQLKDNYDFRFNQMKKNEEELNRIFINIYDMQGEIIPEIEEREITVRKANLEKDIKGFLSYAVGCILGRYSLDVDGLAYAGGSWNASKYTSLIPDKYNCIHLTDEEYFEDDIVGRLGEFVKVVYGNETLEENLDFIANAIGNKGDTSRNVIRNYFIKDFFKDHIKTYKKRPIYWQFDSGKENGFKALIYMHRYNEDSVGTVRTEYLHKIQHVYESEIIRMDMVIDSTSNATEKARALKRKGKLTKQLSETKAYDSAMSHIALKRIPVNLDDGVKVNYDKFQDIEVSQGDGKKSVKVNLLSRI